MQKGLIPSMSTNIKHSFEEIEELSNLLQIQTMTFFVKKFKDPEEKNKIINLLISGHISSLLSLMRVIAEENTDIKRRIDKFMEKLIKFLKIKW